LVRYLIKEGRRVLGTRITPYRMPTLSISHLEVRNNMHWLEKEKHLRCCVFHEK
jgi:hypothetical protein